MFKNNTTPVDFQEIKLTKHARTGLIKLIEQLSEHSNESKTVESAISACKHLLKNF